MNKEEYFKRMINRICKDYGYDVATAFEGLYLEKNKEIDRLNNIINELEKWLVNINKTKLNQSIALNFSPEIEILEVLDKLKELKEK